MRKGSSVRPTPKSGRQQEGHRRRHPQNQHERRQYTLLNNVEDEGSDTETEMFLRGLAQEWFMEKEVQPGDTLQTLAIQFNCPVAELKRLNNIHRDNEIFARRVVRVPVKPISLLTRKLPEVHVVNVSDKQNISEEQTCDSYNNCSINVASEVLQSELMKQNREMVATTTLIDQCQTDEDSDLERQDNSAAPLLTKQDLESAIVNPLSESESNSPYSCSGADWGLSWSQLLICSLLLGFAGPLLYVLYIAENEKAHKQQ